MWNHAIQSTDRRPGAKSLIIPTTGITQAMLEDYHQLKQLESDRRALRGIILDLLAAGAPIEPGEWTAHTTDFEYRNLSRPKLAQVLGETRVNELRELIEPTRVRQLKVERRPGRGA